MEFLINNLQQLSTPQNALYAAGTLATIFVANKIIKNWKIKATYKKYKVLARNARQKRDAYLKNTVIPDHGISEKLQTKILTCSLEELKGLLDSLQITSEQLLNFYAKRMHTIGWEHKMITESNYEAALIKAKHCDKLRKSNPQECKGELFGVVITIKDTFDLKGLASTIGCAAKLNDIPKEDGLFVQIYQNAGAIFYAKTNIPQIAMAIESINEIWGTAENPWNKKRSCGGSSGGSAGSIAAKCSPLCFGSDIGGSIRTPAAFNGVTSLKPCTRRITYNGHTYYSPAFLGNITIQSSVGPISRYVDDCALAMEAYCNEENYKGIKKSVKDMYLNIKPWDKKEYNSTRKMKIGYYKSLDAFPAVKSAQRAVMESVEALRKQGHELVEFQPPAILEILDAYLKIILSDCGKSFTDVLQGEEPLSFYVELLGLYNSTSFFRNTLSKFLSLIGEKRLSAAVSGSHGIDSYEFRNVTYQIQQYRTQYIELMENNNFDAIVCPAFGHCSGQHNFSKDLLLPFIYPAMYNLLDFPAGVVPVTLVQEDEQIYEDNYNDMLTKLAKKLMKDSKGMPIAVQVVSYPLQEETAMNVMKQIENQIQFQKKHPLNI